MTGQIKIVLCDADIHEALSEYLNRHFLEKHRVKVSKFEYRELRTGNNEWTILANSVPTDEPTIAESSINKIVR